MGGKWDFSITFTQADLICLLLYVCLFSECDDLPGYHTQHIFLFFSIFWTVSSPKHPMNCCYTVCFYFLPESFHLNSFGVQICPVSVAGICAKENRNCRVGRRAQCAVCLSEPYAPEPIRTVQEKRGDKTRV